MLTITTPLPLSLNHAYVTGKHGKRFLSPKVAAFKTEVEWITKQALRDSGQTFSPDARFATELVLHFADNRRRDCDNLHKNLADAVFNVLGVDDCRIDDIHIRRGQRVRGKGYAVFTISEIP